MSKTRGSDAYFARVAGQWDEMRAGYFTEAMRDAAIEKMNLTSGAVVADIGAGTGFMVAGLAPRAARVWGLDASVEMLAVAEKNLSAFDNVTLRQAEGSELPLPDESVDGVTANMYLHHAPYPVQAIREMARILKPGGVLCLTDLDTHTNEWLRTEMADTWLGFEREQVREWLMQAGLTAVEVGQAAGTCNSTSPAGDELRLSIFLALGRKPVEKQAGTEIQNHKEKTEMSTEQVKEQVREHYGALAKTALAGNSGCCGSQALDCCTGQTIPEQALAAIGDEKAMPQEVVATSLGCGTPLELAALKPGETVLDLGSGGGLDCFYAARLVGPEGRAIGVDMTPEMLALANKNKEKVGLGNVEFRKGFLEALPVEDESVDVVISNCVINLSPDKEQVFREAFRVLKPGGRVAFSDEIARFDLPTVLKKNIESWSACVAGAIPAEQYKAGIEKAGFRDVTMHGDPGKVEVVYSAVFTATKPAAE